MNADYSHKYKYLIKNIISFLCGNLGTKLIGFFMVPLYTNMLNPSEYGEIDLIISIAGIVSPFIACGIHEGIMRFLLDKNSDKKLILSIGLRVFIISSILTLLLCPLLKFIPIMSENICFLYLYCVLNELMTICLCFIRGSDNIKLYSFLGFLSAFFTASLNILYLVILDKGLLGYKFSMLLSPILTIFIAVILGKIIPQVTVSRWDKCLSKQMLKYSLILIPNAILWWLINASDRLCVSYILGTYENGIYAVSYKLPTLLSTGASILMQSWQMSAIKECDNKANTKFYNQIYRIFIFLMRLASIVLILLNKSLTYIYVAAEYRNAWIYSLPLIAAFFVGSLSSFWGSFYIASKKMPRYLNSALSGAIVNISLNIILIPNIGILGAAIATFASYVVVMLVRSLGVCKNIGIRILNIQLISASICIFIGIISAFLQTKLSWYIGIMNLALYLFINIKQNFQSNDNSKHH